MKRICQIPLLLSAIVLLTVSCKDRAIEKLTYTANVPVYAKSDIGLVKTSSPQELEEQGKIHIRGSQLFIVKPLKGVHVFDNSNPKSPSNVAFIEIPGVMDIFTKGNILYADSYWDLLAIDIADIQNAKEVDREKKVFNQVLPVTENDYPIEQVDPDKGIVIGWVVREVETTNEASTNDGWFESTRQGQFNFDHSGGGSTASVTFMSNGVSGSLARFIAYDDALYTLTDSEIQVFNISNAADPVKGRTLNVNRLVETLFPYGDKLFVGTSTGMVVYGIQNPLNPVYVSDFNHSTACDPVVVADDFAYVTLRGGTECGGFNNQLDVIDVSDISNPDWVKSYSLTSPYGLGIDGDILFICDGDAGLKVYNVSDKTKIDENLIAHYSEVVAFDVIPLNGLLLVIAADGLYQYDYSDPANIQQLSVI